VRLDLIREDLLEIQANLQIGPTEEIPETYLALHLLKEYGRHREFHTAGRMWEQHRPYSQPYYGSSKGATKTL